MINLLIEEWLRGDQNLVKGLLTVRDSVLLRTVDARSAALAFQKPHGSIRKPMPMTGCNENKALMPDFRATGMAKLEWFV
jgi:hypothetical protein